MHMGGKSQNVRVKPAYERVWDEELCRETRKHEKDTRILHAAEKLSKGFSSWVKTPSKCEGYRKRGECDEQKDETT